MNRRVHRRGRMGVICILMLIGLMVLAPAARAGVVRVEIASREAASDAPQDGPAGPYEVLKGIIYLEVDPDDPANGMVVDLDLAERNERGNVEFSTDFEMHKPVDADRGNGRLMYFVNNRGHKMGLGHFCYEAGENWLYRNGWSFLWCGWNCDVIPSDRTLNIYVPVATQNGKTITGRVYTEIISYSDFVENGLPLVWGGSVAYEPVNMNEPDAVLNMRQYRWEGPVEVPRDQWSFARVEDGRPVPDPGHLYVNEGIKPGWLYDLVYTAKDPKVTGLGLAAIRDVVSYFRYEEVDDAGTPNPLAGAIEHTYSWGHSQSARLLYHFLYEGFNGDEKGRMVFDGVQANCGGGGKGQFNSRFAQTTRHGSHHEDNLFPIDFFPFNTVEQYDPVTGERGDGLERVRKSGVLPKIFFINSATDYWTRAASLLHTDVEGKRDAEIDPNVRIYAIAGRAHVDDRIGLVGRALLTALDEWVTDGVEPPESQIPRISDGTLVPIEEFREAFPAIPGVLIPESYYNPYRLDPGPRWRAEGIADNVPPKTGPKYVCLVPQVDADGNDIAGVRLPEVALPLATFTGWTMRNPGFSRTLGRNTGRVWQVPATAGERERTGDPRESLEERFDSGGDYLEKAKQCLSTLRGQRLLLDEDHNRLQEQAVIQSAFIGDLRPLEDVVLQDGPEAGLAHLEQVDASGILLWIGRGLRSMEGMINSKGYEYLYAGELESALKLFKFNTLAFPDNANTWDSLGECYLALGELDLSKENYEKSLELNPENTNAVRMLEGIEWKAGGGRIDSGVREEAVREVAGVIRERYADPEAAEVLAETIITCLQRGEFDSADTADSLVAEVMKVIRSRVADRHFKFSLRDEFKISPDESPDRERSPHGLRTTRMLRHETAYLELDGLPGDDESMAAVEQAITELPEMEAIVIDLRDNNGGSADMVVLLCNHLLEANSLLCTFSSRSGGSPVEIRSASAVPRFGTEVPVFVLVGEATISAAEALAFILQDFGRATVVGERTAGMANPSRTYSVEPVFEVTVPFLIARYGEAGGTFAGTGVKPDIEVPADAALDVALDEIGNTLESE
ncbi:MAG: alpha/beta hydrolase domain-containing protein [bacterium]